MTGEYLAGTPRFHRVLGAAAGIARSRGHSYIGVEHLFLAILHDPDAVPTQALAQVADVGAVEDRLLAIMNSESYRTPSTGVRRPPGPGRSDGGADPGPDGRPR
jgi:ATP-dependent Clp protease ATP-binding subunit ClpA